MKPSRFLFIFLLIAIPLWLYAPSLQYYFFQDDFYTLLHSRIPDSSLEEYWANGPGEFQAEQTSSYVYEYHGHQPMEVYFSQIVSFFIPGQEIYYRPLSLRIYFYLMQVILGPQPLYFHFVSLSLHIFNSFLVLNIVSKLLNRWFAGWVAAFLYVTSSTHFISLYWISETGLVMGVTLYLLSCILFLRYLQAPSRRLLLLIFFIFLLGLLTHEYLLTLPVILAGMMFIHQPNLKNLVATVRRLAAFWFLGIVYLVGRLILFPLPVSGSYIIVLGKPTLHALFWYLVWSLNTLEHLKDKLEPGLSLNQAFISQYPLVVIATLLSLILTVIFLVAIPIIRYQRANSSIKNQINHYARFIIFWLVVTFSIPLATPLHLYPLYASLPLVGIVMTIAVIGSLLYHRSNLFFGIVIVIWTLLSWQTLRLTEKIHWTTQEARRVKSIFISAAASLPHVPSDSTIVIPPDYQIREALYGDLGLQFAYNDPSLTTYYGSIQDIMPPACAKLKDQTACLADHRIFWIKP